MVGPRFAGLFSKVHKKIVLCKTPQNSLIQDKRKTQQTVSFSKAGSCMWQAEFDSGHSTVIIQTAGCKKSSQKCWFPIFPSTFPSPCEPCYPSASITYQITTLDTEVVKKLTWTDIGKTKHLKTSTWLYVFCTCILKYIWMQKLKLPNKMSVDYWIW